MWLSDSSIKQPVLITMLLLATMIIGAISYSRMPVDLFPDVTFPVVAVSSRLAGASPEEVETLLTKPIEDALVSIGNVNQ
ncbi:MAG: efflux RND transporter permease subunit, partial [Chloroflexota bacterium]